MEDRQVCGKLWDVCSTHTVATAGVVVTLRQVPQGQRMQVHGLGDTGLTIWTFMHEEESYICQILREIEDNKMKYIRSSGCDSVIIGPGTILWVVLKTWDNNNYWQQHCQNETALYHQVYYTQQQLQHTKCSQRPGSTAMKSWRWHSHPWSEHTLQECQ